MINDNSKISKKQIKKVLHIDLDNINTEELELVNHYPDGFTPETRNMMTPKFTFKSSNGSTASFQNNPNSYSIKNAPSSRSAINTECSRNINSDITSRADSNSEN